jgi:GTP:adenosylcobinamide-phosphate guanylyltransferase
VASNTNNKPRTISSVIYKNGSIVAGTGSTYVSDANSVGVLVGNSVLSLTVSDLLIVYAIANDTSTFIDGTSCIYVADNTSTTITITMLR